MTPDLRQCTGIYILCFQNSCFLQFWTIWTQNALLSPRNTIPNAYKRVPDFFFEIAKIYLRFTWDLPWKPMIYLQNVDFPQISPKSLIFLQNQRFFSKISPHPDSKSILVDPCPVLPRQFWVFRRSLAPLKLRFRETNAQLHHKPASQTNKPPSISNEWVTKGCFGRVNLPLAYYNVLQHSIIFSLPALRVVQSYVNIFENGLLSTDQY